MRIARVFPRRTKATPIDELSFYDEPGLFAPGVDEVHISVTFTWDLPRANYLFNAWQEIAPIVKIGGPATGMKGKNFKPGCYLKPGYVITSRGCPNRCWFCSVWKRDGDIRELPITNGYNILDDNLLACSNKHILAVFQMLKKQKERAQFTGGLEAKRLKGWHADLLMDLNPAQIFFAYDTPDDWEPLVNAARMMKIRGFNRNILRAYVLIGYPGDILNKAIDRLEKVKALGICPMAMLWRNNTNETEKSWRKLQRAWARPAIIYSKNNRQQRIKDMELEKIWL